MIVYHGANTPVEYPDTNHSNKYLDFGQGFYVTIYKEQAEKWAKRKAMRYGGKPVVSVYNFSEKEATQFKLKNFAECEEEWLDFICACRKGENIYMQYDIVIGNVADDDVFKSVDMYFRKIWNKERTLEEIRYYKHNNQITFITQQAIDSLLNYTGYYEVDEQYG